MYVETFYRLSITQAWGNMHCMAQKTDREIYHESVMGSLQITDSLSMRRGDWVAVFNRDINDNVYGMCFSLNTLETMELPQDFDRMNTVISVGEWPRWARESTLNPNAAINRIQERLF